MNEHTPPSCVWGGGGALMFVGLFPLARCVICYTRLRCDCWRCQNLLDCSAFPSVGILFSLECFSWDVCRVLDSYPGLVVLGRWVPLNHQAIVGDTRRHMHIKVMSRVLYRADLPGQFADPTAGIKEHSVLAAQEAKDGVHTKAYGP